MSRALSVAYYNFPTPAINTSSLTHRAFSAAYSHLVAHSLV